jgi:hypothetical protein
VIGFPDTGWSHTAGSMLRGVPPEIPGRSPEIGQTKICGMEIRSGTLTALYLFDVAESIDLTKLRDVMGAGSAARLPSKSPTPPYVRYQVPPLIIEGETAAIGAIEGFTARLKFFDYGVVSLALSRPFTGEWSDLVRMGQEYIENAALEARAEEAVRRVVARCGSAMSRLRPSWLDEDYLIVAVHDADDNPNADALVARRGEYIAQFVRGETQPLSRQEQEEILRAGLSYLANDLVVPTWNAAFVYDTEAGAAAAHELFEFANSQLLEFRYYDALLDAELARIYPALQHTSWWSNLVGGRAVRTANAVHSLFIDVNEITDRTENALKIVGDIYAARVLALVSGRLGLGRWKQSVDEKLKTLDDIYRFVVEQVSISRGQFLEITVVVILILELIPIFLGLTR